MNLARSAANIHIRRNGARDRIVQHPHPSFPERRQVLRQGRHLGRQFVVCRQRLEEGVIGGPFLDAEIAAGALIDEGGVGEAIGKDDLAAGERGVDPLLDTLPAAFASASSALAVGLALGRAGAFAALGLLRNYLFGLSRLDGTAYAGVLLTPAGLVATYLPAQRRAAAQRNARSRIGSVVQTTTRIDDVRSWLAPLRYAPRTIGFVPTMGALHAGHLRLIEEAKRNRDWLVVSIFVNPPQFNEQKDLLNYPRPLEADEAFCETHGVDLLFTPTVEEMYPQANCSWIEVSSVGKYLCGQHRPGHFRAVATVVMKLFQIVQPNRAYFGEKDAQQLAVVRRMSADLNIPVAVIGVPTVREPDGLAISSRNVHLTGADRAIAPRLHLALQCAAEQIREGQRSPGLIRRAGMAVLEAEPRIEIDYFEIVDPDEMQPLAAVHGSVRIAAAIRIGSVRLIDNILVTVGQPG